MKFLNLFPNPKENLTTLVTGDYGSENLKNIEVMDQVGITVLKSKLTDL